MPYTTLHVGRIAGGVALNIVPNRCEIEFEIRNLAADDPQALLDGLAAEAARIAEATGVPEAGIEIAVTNAYPGLDTPPGSEAVRLSAELAGTGTTKVAYGTEGGLFAEMLGLATVVCGPGGHGAGAQARRVRDRSAARRLRRHARAAGRAAARRASSTEAPPGMPGDGIARERRPRGAAGAPARPAL